MPTQDYWEVLHPSFWLPVKDQRLRPQGAHIPTQQMVYKKWLQQFPSLFPKSFELEFEATPTKKGNVFPTP